MLSILVPTYNYDVVPLAKSLLRLCERQGLEYEILFADDHSTNLTLQKHNRDFFCHTTINYIEAKENMGRSKIRNFLVDSSKGDILLFLDCDSGIIREDFIEKYLQFADKYDVVLGGTTYCDRQEIEDKYLLHWKFGKQREENQKHFTTNNFLIKKAVFNSIRFDEGIKGYGHEDTLLGMELSERGYSICFIDNPVNHLGLKTKEKFLSDVLCATKNLALLYQQPNYKDYLLGITLIKAYKKLQSLHLQTLYCAVFGLFRKCAERNLHSHNPRLLYLDLIKLYTFIKQMK